MKKLILAFVLFTASFTLFAQAGVDPTDRFYSEAQGWELKGYIPALPQIRPYPSNLIKSILEKVMTAGDQKDRETALYEYERLFSKKANIYVTGAAQYKSSENLEKKTDSGTKNLKGEGGISGEVIFNPLVSLGYDLGMYGESADYEDIAPYYKNKAEDAVFDPASVGPLDFYIDWNANVAFGTNEYYVMAGLSKTGYGSFLSDGLALNDSSFHSANIIMNVTRPKWSYASVFEVIGATTNNPAEYTDHLDGKFLSFHSIKYRFNRFVDLAYYENIVFGPTFNPAYMIPVPFMPVQNIGGANDNLQMGLLFNVHPITGLEWSTDIFVDDFEVNEVVKLNFDSKIRVAGQTGLVFTPTGTACSRISLDYQMVLPYVYAHWEYQDDNSAALYGSTANRQNYTNAGVNIGSSLDPNSDKVSFSASFTPKPFLRFNFSTNFIRHSNSAECFDEDDAAVYVLADKGQYATDGTAYMHQMFSNPEGALGTHVDQAWEHLGFMTSDHKMGILQATLNTEIDLPRTKRGMFTLFAGYTFEFVKNAGVNSNIYTGGTIDWSYKYDSATDTYTYYKGVEEVTKEALYNEAKEKAAEQKQKWIDSLTDKVNHYITVGFRWTY